MNEKVYDQDTLQHLKQVELDILKDFIKICQKYNLTYFATGGTAIGALRHQGFIPWDDDIDVCMLRKDYDTFMRVAPKEMGDTYIFMDAHTEPRYPLMFGKMIKKALVLLKKPISRLIILWESILIFSLMTRHRKINLPEKNYRKRPGILDACTFLL